MHNVPLEPQARTGIEMVYLAPRGEKREKKIAFDHSDTTLLSKVSKQCLWE